MNPDNKQKMLYRIISIGAVVGLIASFDDTLEKISLLKNSHSILTCNLNSVFSCSNVLNAHQSSVFGFPNSLLCIVFFSVTLSAGLIGWFGGRIIHQLRYVYQALALFFAGFGYWFFWQSIFNLHSLCILCIFCYAGVLTINIAWFRLDYKDFHFSKIIAKTLDRVVVRGADIFFWSLVALSIVLEAILKLT
jgi:uncharacterized membrane protein